MAAGAISAQAVSFNPIWLKRIKRGNQTAVKGTINTANENSVSRVRHVRETCAIAKPAHDATRIVSGTATTTTNVELAA